VCGIAAIFVYGESAPPVDRAEVTRMREQMFARGPDGEGEWFSQDGRIGLGHRRLPIIDLSPAGRNRCGTPTAHSPLSFDKLPHGGIVPQ